MEITCIYVVCKRKRARVTTPPLGTHASRTRFRYTLILRDNLDRAIDKVCSHPQRLHLRCVTRLALWGTGCLVHNLHTDMPRSSLMSRNRTQSPPHDGV